MANFSVELRTIVEAGVNIFGFPYEFYNEEKRAEFERNFIRHFYFREIGCESTERFRWYLEDKMQTVFPYYNALFQAAQIEYNILDNYNVREEYTITRDGVDKENNVSSSVGRASDNQTSETQSFRDATTSSTTDGTDLSTVTETGKSERDLGTTQTEDGKTTTNEQKSGHGKNMFLDTPQGKLSLLEKDYLTNMTETTQEDNNQSTVNKEGTIQTDTDETIDTTKTTTANGSSNQTATGKDETQETGSTVMNGEHRATHDNNSRSERVGSHVEKSVYTKKGNIGIDTDSDMITKHITLQKVLRNIERMFFDECEDLFMLVYE